MHSSPLARTAQPRHALVARSLADQIAANKFAVGELLPTEAELCAQFDVSRTTLREAMRWLRDRGMVSSRAGVGTVVLAKRPAPRYVHAIESISDLFQYAKSSRNPVILATEEFGANAATAGLLKCSTGQRWIRIELTRTFAGDKTPILFSKVYVPHAYAGIVPLVPMRKEPIYTLLEKEYGERVIGVEQEFRSAPIKRSIARHLDVRAGAAGLVVVRHYFGAGERLLLVTVSTYNSDRYSYKMRLRFNPLPSGGA